MPTPSCAERRSRSPCAAAARPASRSSARSASCCPKRAAEVGLDPGDLNIHLVEGRPGHPLRPAAPRSARKARAAAREAGRRSRDRLDGRARRRRSTSRSPTAERSRRATLVWCGGAKADPHAVGVGLHAGQRRADPRSDPTARPTGSTTSTCSATWRRSATRKDNRVLPMLAQFAITRAEHAAGNILSPRSTADRRRRSCPTSTASSSASGRAGAWAGCSASTLSGVPGHLHEAAHVRPVLVAGRRSQARVEARARAARDAAVA